MKSDRIRGGADSLQPRKNRQRAIRAAWSGGLLLLIYVLVVNAWVVDDAYITLRTVDNFVNGYGLTWNVAERVQVYTHPLWMFVLATGYWITSESFFTTLALSFLLALASVFVARKVVQAGIETWWKPMLLILALISSKAVIDYASSGLENPLSYLLAAVFLGRLQACRLSQVTPDTSRVRDLILIAALAFVNRPDTVLLYLPALLYALWAARSQAKGRVLAAVVVGLLPAILWELFAFFYYGYAFPNTVYAKVLSTGFPYSWKLQRGFEYAANSLTWDSASYAISGIALLLTIRKRSMESGLALAGAGLYILYAIHSAASATHMSGRFFAVPFFVTILVCIRMLPTRRAGLALGGALVLYIALSPVSAIKFGTTAYHEFNQSPSMIDTKWFVAQEGAALINWRPGKAMPDHAWYHDGEQLRAQGAPVHVGGAFGGEAIGYVGFAAGPSIYIIDRVGLGDPLLSRLPAVRPQDFSKWKSGHFHRLVPDGYEQSVVQNSNLISDPKIRQYYDVVRTITRGRLLSWERMVAIVNMNLGRYEYLLK